MIGLEIVAPKGLGFVSFGAFTMKKGSNGYGGPRATAVANCEKVKDEPTRVMISTDNGDEKHFFHCVMTDVDGNITPWSKVISLKPMKPEAIQVPVESAS